MGIVLAVCGAGLYFLRSFKPALARDYDVFFAAIGLLCGGILFFQGWRLDPILQFGQFLLAGTTVFFAYESVRLRGIATDQARRSSYFDDEPSARMPSGGVSGGWDDSYDQFEESRPLTRRFSGRDEQGSEPSQEDFYRPRRISRAAIPEQAASRTIRNRGSEEGSWRDESAEDRRMSRFGSRNEEVDRNTTFGNRRNLGQEQRRGSRPSVNRQTANRRRSVEDQSSKSLNKGEYSASDATGVPPRTPSPIRDKAEDAAFSPSRSSSSRSKGVRSNRSSTDGSSSRYSSNAQSRRTGSSKPRRRDNSSRFDD